MDRRRFLYLSGLAALAAGCGSTSTDSASFTTTTSPGPLPQSLEFGRGARRSTPEQIANAIQGLDPFVAASGGGKQRLSLATTVPSKAQLPAAILPPVRNQGPLESCGSFGIGYSLASGMAALAHPGLDLTEPKNQSSSAYIYKVAYTAEGLANALADQSGPDSGTYAKDYFHQLIAGGGNTTWRDVGYPEASLGEDAMCGLLDQIMLGAAQLDSRFALGSWHYYSDLATTKAHLSAGTPVAFLVECYKNFTGTYKDPSGKNVFVGEGDPNDGGHFMSAIGYDDNMGPNGALLIQNSWGKDWGFNGLVWFDYVSFMKSLEYFYVGLPVSTGGTGTPLTSGGSGGTGGALTGVVTRAHQVAAGNAVHLVFFLELSRPVELSSMHLLGPNGGQWMSFHHRMAFRSGYLYASRRDAMQFRQGTYMLELDTTDGHHLVAPIAIPPLDSRPEGDLHSGITGSHGQAGGGRVWG